MRPVFNHTVLVPAFHHQYDTREACLQAWDAGKDFRIIQGSYCSNRDLPVLQNMSTVYIHLNNLGISIQVDTN